MEGDGDASAEGGRTPERPHAVTGFIRPRSVVRVPPCVPLTLGDLVEVEAPPAVRRKVEGEAWERAPGTDRHMVVSLLSVLHAAARLAPDVLWQALGDRDIVVETEVAPGPGRWVLGALVWCLLFIGAATTLLNFHADVNMPAAHRELYYLATGRHSNRPLVVEIPYAIGLGLGSLLFFAVPRHGSGDPGPLELEVMRYEERLRDYWRARRHRRAHPPER